MKEGGSNKNRYIIMGKRIQTRKNTIFDTFINICCVGFNIVFSTDTICMKEGGSNKNRYIIMGKRIQTRKNTIFDTFINICCVVLQILSLPNNLLKY